ncbi:MAG: zinc ribbon domain-containing protein [Planctomycetes bacterium]|nr:zinc ribbon domain-containing protein [Planctomycetota bacterium]
MPTYDYECGGCGHAFEAFQSVSEPHLKRCPECKKPKLQRLFGGGAGFLFKGSGFYTTDYRSAGYESAAKADGPGGCSGDPTSCSRPGCGDA